MTGHDALYHRLFSHPEMVVQLLRDFVDEAWLEEVDLTALQRLSTKFHARSGQQRNGDIVWKLPLRRGGEAYLLLMLEFQSRSDRWMALRIQVYLGLLWQQLIDEKALPADGLLPPVLPVVLYNGDPRWAASLSLRPLISLPAGSPFWRWQPEMRYHIIDEGAYAAEDLAARDSLAALLFRLEQCRDPEAVVPLVDEMIDWFHRHPGFTPLMSAFSLLAGRVMDAMDGGGPAVRVSENLLETRTMLATRTEEWKQHWKEAGRQEGLQKGLQEGLLKGRQEGLQKGLQEGQQKGRQEGRQEGKAALFLHLLQHRFGPVPPHLRERILAADAAQLEEWSLRLLDATSLDAVFR